MKPFKEALNKMLSTDAEQEKCIAWANERYKGTKDVPKNEMIIAYINEQLLGQ